MSNGPEHLIESASERAVSIVASAFPNLNFPPSTRGVLFEHLYRLEQFLIGMESIQDILEWISRCPSMVREELTIGMESGSQMELISDLIIQIGRGLTLELNTNSDLTVLPWDLFRSARPDWSYLFGFGADPNPKLPVQIWIGPNYHWHDLTLDLALGIIWYSHMSGVEFSPTLGGHILTYFDDLETQRRYRADPSGGCPLQFPAYQLTFERTYWQFSNLEFVQGIRTGTAWGGDDLNEFLAQLWYAESLESDPIPMGWVCSIQSSMEQN